jgi:hypothetical protein
MGVAQSDILYDKLAAQFSKFRIVEQVLSLIPSLFSLGLVIHLPARMPLCCFFRSL